QRNGHQRKQARPRANRFDPGLGKAEPPLRIATAGFTAGALAILRNSLRRGIRTISDQIPDTPLLHAQGVAFQSITKDIDTANATGKLVFHLFGALAEFERNLITERMDRGCWRLYKRLSQDHLLQLFFSSYTASPC